MAINLDSLSPSELQALIKQAQAQMDSARKNHVHQVRAEIDALLKNAKLTLDEVYPRRGGKGAKDARPAVAPKYRNPNDPAQSWSGRSKRPAWFVQALKKGGVTADSLLIDSAASKPPARKAVSKAGKKAALKKKS